MSRPQTIPEWSTYIKSLSSQALLSQAIAANTHSFARTLVAEGATMALVEELMLLFVRQLRAMGVKLPEGGPFDLVTMALVDAVARKGVTYSLEEATFLHNLEESQDDDFSAFELMAAFED